MKACRKGRGGGVLVRGGGVFFFVGDGGGGVGRSGGDGGRGTSGEGAEAAASLCPVHLPVAASVKGEGSPIWARWYLPPFARPVEVLVVAQAALEDTLQVLVLYSQ